MRRYDDHVEVRTGEARSGGARTSGSEGAGPDQFLWRGQLWQVRDVLAHWVETSEWWRGDRARAVAGTETPSASLAGPGIPAQSPAQSPTQGNPLAGLLSEREVWRVEARRPELGAGAERVVRAGVFDLAHDHAADRWQLVSCSD